MGALTDLLLDLNTYPETFARWGSRRKLRPGSDCASDDYGERVQRLLDALHPRRMKLRVIEVIEQTSSTKTFRLERTDGELPSFRAGQYISVLVEVNGVFTNRPYSLSSPPGCGHLEITVRAVPGGLVSNHLLGHLGVGDTLETSGPAGHFHHEPLIDGSELVFLAGGSGITPLMSMIRSAARSGWPLSVTLLYGSRVPTDVIFGDELDELADANPRFRYAPVISEPPDDWDGRSGLLDANRIREEVGDTSDKTCYLCGPQAMIDLCSRGLAKLGVPAQRIRCELNGPGGDVTQLAGWPGPLPGSQTFTVRNAGVEFEAAAGEPLLSSMERAGVVAPAVCRSGECSACRTRLVDGDVFIAPNARLRQSDLHHRYIHPCVAYPISDLVIRI